ncbi:histidine kinase [bacterium]|nr:histidine kinase [bacterium]
MNKKLYVGLSIIPFLVAFLGISTLTQAPYTGLTYELKDGTWYISSVSPKGPAGNIPECTDAEIVAIEDFELESFDLVEDFDYIPDRESLNHWWKAQTYFSRHVKPDKPLVLRLKNGDVYSSAEIVPVRLPVAEILYRVGMMFFLGLFSLIIGLVVVLKKPGDVRARSFFYMVFSVALIFVTFGSYTSRDTAFNITIFSVLRIINIFAFVYFPVLFFHFCCLFPREKKLVTYRFFTPVLYTIPIIVTVLYQPRISYLSLNFLFMAGLASGVGLFIYSYATSKSPHERYQIRWVLGGVGVFSVVFMMTTFIPILVTGQRLFSDRVPSLFFILIPLSMAFAITKYHLMDIDTIFDNSVIYFLTLCILAGLDVGVISTLARLKNLALAIKEPFATVIALWLVVLAYIPVRNNINKGVKRILRRDIYDSLEVSIRLSNKLLAAHNAKTVVDAAVETVIGILHPKGISAYIYGKENDREVAVPYFGECEDSLITLAIKAREYKEPCPLYMIDSEFGKLPEVYTDGVIVTLRTSAGTLGCLLLKNKESGRLYTRQDINLLKTLASQTSMAIESIFLKEESEHRRHEALRERERISREIHDGIGSSFSNALMLINLFDKDADEDKGRSERLKNLKSLLSGGLTELRDLIWTIEEDEYRLGDLISHIQEKAGTILGCENIPFHFEIDVEHESLALPAMVRLNIIRIVQESLANVIKHAEAAKVDIRIKNTAQQLRITIADNGRGYDAEQNRTGSYGLRNMKKRCEEMGGIFFCTSAPGKGTEIIISLQVPQSD